MSNSNYNFRTAFNLAKAEKKHQRETEVDEFLKEIISAINDDTDDDIYENMLEEILFLQTDTSDGTDIEVYLKVPFHNCEEEDFPYQYLCNKTFAYFTEACNFLDLVAKKLEEEGFCVKPYTEEKAVDDGKSFTVIDKPR